MTAEETALEEFRLLAKCARDEMRLAKMMRAERDSDARWFFAMAREYRVQMKSLARIIRAIRRENRGDQMRASYEASVSEQVIHAETAWYDRGYEQGRRDALRGVQAAALYRHAELWQGRVRLTLADERRDIEACELAWAAAKAAEEAAR